MHAYAGKHKDQSVHQQKSNGIQDSELLDKRPTNITQRRMQDRADSGPQVARLNAVQRMANSNQQSKVMQLAEVTSTDKYADLLEDVSAKHLYLGISWRPSNVMNRGIDFSTGTYASILVHLMNNGQNSKWVSTTTDLNVAKSYAGDGGFIYHCHGVTNQGLSAKAAYAKHWNNKDEQADLREVNKTAKSATYPFDHQKEISVWNSVNADSIIGAYTKVNGEWRRYKRGAYLNSPTSLPQEVQDRL